ncbi:hypothetical protein [Saccharothrix saharensis]|nr:hypothetical protein [Saccharothrix saharensis]
MHNTTRRELHVERELPMEDACHDPVTRLIGEGATPRHPVTAG